MDWIIIYGSIENGFRFFGPYDSREAATLDANDSFESPELHCDGATWKTVKLDSTGDWISYRKAQIT